MKSVADAPQHRFQDTLAQSLEGTTDSDASFDIARYWLKQCEEAHIIWGGMVPLRLLQANMTALQTSIDLSQLPNTFRDAVGIVKRLELRHLWIDSLCIIQDSPNNEDWAKESVKMGDVYKHSWCNLAASKARNANGGCYTQRTAQSALPCAVRARVSGRAPVSLYCWDGDMLGANLDESNLVRRGWVVQEKILSRRVLHFCADQLFWECVSLRACEMFPGGVPNNTAAKPSTNTVSLRNHLLRSRDPVIQRYQLWDQFVQIYTRANLTFPEKDKLVAISGLARELFPNGQYLAGLWRDILPYQLMWSTSSGDCTSRDNERAPSWSWASINGPLFARTPTEHGAGSRLLATVLEATTKLTGDDAFGRVSAGEIRLEVPLCRVTVSRCYDRYN
ncbi:hypothetical protein M8818_000911 [Zalaria obscura]|uniref:Uncharacterized protein n=1 Tax=Zalaria obscura TaxID=2024903 RepID=A0ACC3SLM3_9PEZI